MAHITYLIFFEQMKCHTNNMLHVYPCSFNIVKQHPKKTLKEKRNGPSLIIFVVHNLDAIRPFIRLCWQWALLSPNYRNQSDFRFSNYFLNWKPFSIPTIFSFRKLKIIWTSSTDIILYKYCLLLSIEYWTKAIALIWYL